MSVRYQDHVDDLSPDHLRGGFWDGWSPNPPTPATHLALLQGSTHRIVAIDAATGHVVGFVTAVSDGVLCAYIPLLEVLPAYKGRGIGTELMRRLLAALDEHYMIDLLCDEDVQPFYARLGMQTTTGMAVRNYDRQAGADLPA